MIFTLEVLEAKKGDCLLLHYGNNKKTEIIVIDGGPAGVYRGSLKPRLLEIKEHLAPDSPLPLEMVMVSHFDDDHLNGILQMTGEVRNAQEDGQAPPFQIKHLWFNAFDDIVGNAEVASFSGIRPNAASANALPLTGAYAQLDHHVGAVLASTGQGRQLRNDAKFLSVPVNSPFPPPADDKPSLVRADVGQKPLKWGKTLKITVLHPNKQRLVELQAEWDKDLALAKSRGDDSVIVASLADVDKSPFNLSSIVCMVELKKKRILLTGDARCDDILDGLRQAKLLDAQGKIHVDILKIPHHGSERNVTPEFFQSVTADHYVVSGDGSHHNPDKSTLDMLAAATAPHNNFTIHFTNHDGRFDLKKKLDAFASEQQALGRTFTINYRQDATQSILLQLLDKIDY